MKKLSKRNIIIISVAAVAVVVIGVIAAVVLTNIVSARQANEKNAYLALRFLKDGNSNMAEEYLGRVEDDAGKKVRFAVDSAEVIRQQIIGNTTLSTVGIDILNGNYELDDDRSSIVTFLSNGMDSVSQNGYGSVIDQIIKQMEIPEKRREKYDEQYSIEQTAFSIGYLPEESEETYRKMLGNKALDELVLSMALSSGNYNRAFMKAVDLVSADPSDENKLLLADIIASAAYADVMLDNEYMYTAAGKKYDPEKIEKEAEGVVSELDDLEGDIFDLEVRIANTEEGQQKVEMQEQLERLYERRKNLEIKRNNPMLYRAINSVATIPSVEAAVVKSKLYYAAGFKDEAVSTLKGAAGSFFKRFCGSSKVVRGLGVIDNLYNGDGSSNADASASAIVADMLDVATEYLSVVDLGYGYVSTSMSSAFAAELLEAFKYQDNDIYITKIDDSEYPKVTVTVNGRQQVIDDILHKRNVKVRDTRYDVDYEVEKNETAISSICFVVDISGSMSGEPIENAKKALRSFVQTMNDTTEVSIVAFDDMHYERTPLTTDENELLNGIGTLDAAGGTNISEGIVGGIESLREAAGAKNIILMTDGQSYEEYGWLNDALSEGVTIFTVGFGDVNVSYLTEIAEQTGGTFTLADSSGDLDSVYASIGAVIGNQANITYTVTENVDEVPRYVYVRSEKFNASQSREYRTVNGENRTVTADTFVLYDGLFFETSYMDSYREQNQTVYISVNTSDNDEVETLEIDGQTYTPEEDRETLRFNLMPLDEGLYNVKFNFKDGSSYTAEDAIFVYDDSQDSEIKTYAYEDIRIGCVVINANFVVVLPDGTVVMQGIELHNFDNSSSWSLDAETNNLMIFENVGISDSTENGYRLWGDIGSFRLDGTITLSGYDKQNAQGYSTISSKGKIRGEIDSDQCSVNADTNG